MEQASCLLGFLFFKEWAQWETGCNYIELELFDITGGTPVPHGSLISTVEQASNLLGFLFVGETGHKYKGLHLG